MKYARLPKLYYKYSELIFPETELLDDFGKVIDTVSNITNVQEMDYDTRNKVPNYITHKLEMSYGTDHLYLILDVETNIKTFKYNLLRATQKPKNDFIWYNYHSDGVANKVKRRIVSAANRYGDIIIPANRHHSALMDTLINRILGSGDEEIAEEVMKAYISSGDFDDGFIDNYGEFWTREQAMIIASVSNQLIRVTGGTQKLFSEDIY